jgi:lipopolysaccharide transport system ATP-binding protein
MDNSDVVIRVEGLGKKYSLNHQKSERYTALRDVVARQAKAAGRLLNPFTLAGQLRKFQQEAAQEPKAREEEFWALKDVSFEIRRGERVGIIGRNGAGKSTLLKILSRITEPTTGRVEILGRVASLLEVGTGFHPELTGRENVYLNGAILGMTRREIRSKFDEIVDFAEVEKFLDTPVKRYSSGMYVRLAFAVAAHLEPEILVVDEVLAVGDASFQKKCLGKMEDVAENEGRTVLFVSHNMAAIAKLCSTALLIKSGIIAGQGPTELVASQYLTCEGFVDGGQIFSAKKPSLNQKLIIKSLRLFNRLSPGSATPRIERSDAASIEVMFDVLEAGTGYNISLEFTSILNGPMLTTTLADFDPVNLKKRFLKCNSYVAVLQLPSNFFRDGQYSVRAAAAVPGLEVLDILGQELFFEVTDSSSPAFHLAEGRRGIVMPILTWTIS